MTQSADLQEAARLITLTYGIGRLGTKTLPSER